MTNKEGSLIAENGTHQINSHVISTKFDELNMYFPPLLWTIGTMSLTFSFLDLRQLRVL